MYDAAPLTLYFGLRGFEASKLFFKSLPKSAATASGGQNYPSLPEGYVSFFTRTEGVQTCRTSKVFKSINVKVGILLVVIIWERIFFQNVLLHFTLNAKREIFQEPRAIVLTV